jgi:hypothetical protein
MWAGVRNGPASPGDIKGLIGFNALRLGIPHIRRVCGNLLVGPTVRARV